MTNEEVNSFISDTFISIWTRRGRTLVDTRFLTRLNNYFDVDRMVRLMNVDIEGSTERQVRERYHYLRLAAIIDQFTNELYELTRERNIEERDIFNAKERIKANRNCDAYPC
jgi:hypothetical protein